MLHARISQAEKLMRERERERAWKKDCWTIITTCIYVVRLHLRLRWFNICMNMTMKMTKYINKDLVLSRASHYIYSFSNYAFWCAHIVSSVVFVLWAFGTFLFFIFIRIMVCIGKYHSHLNRIKLLDWRKCFSFVFIFSSHSLAVHEVKTSNFRRFLLMIFSKLNRFQIEIFKFNVVDHIVWKGQIKIFEWLTLKK